MITNPKNIIKFSNSPKLSEINSYKSMNIITNGGDVNKPGRRTSCDINWNNCQDYAIVIGGKVWKTFTNLNDGTPFNVDVD